MHIPWPGVLPFAGLLACIAVFPLLRATARLWERRWFQLLVSLGFGVPVGVWIWAAGDSHAVIHALVEYAQFITLLLALFVVSGGIFLSGDIRATPRNNTLFLAVGAVVASIVGTTGAAMLLIRPLLNTNQERQQKTHTVVFVILIVANAGGLLTPLGDPPLFLGLLRGVPFTWTLKLLPEWLFVNGLLLLTYYALDCRAYAREPAAALIADQAHVRPLSVHGAGNFVLFALIVAGVAVLPSVNLGAILHGTAGARDWLPIRELVLIAAATASFLLGDRKTRFVDNRFSWHPIAEVAVLFAGIFLTMVPALKYLGQVAPRLPLDAITLFIFSGGLSSVLDNAPTYATFFEMARQLPTPGPRVAGVPELFLVAISLGAVMCGANTYIGNGPNFMVKSIADSRNVPMPSFGGYFVRWALPFHLPVLALMVLIFLVRDWRVNVAGGVGAALLAAGYLRLARRARHARPGPGPAA
jgi:Na+/H+ antiporter NhaD/arsenite permease-like protein